MARTNTVWLERGKVYKVTLTPMNTSNLSSAGHRVRLEVAGLNPPRFDRNLNTGGNNYDETASVIETYLHPSLCAISKQRNPYGQARPGKTNLQVSSVG